MNGAAGSAQAKGGGLRVQARGSREAAESEARLRNSKEFSNGLHDLKKPVGILFFKNKVIRASLNTINQ